VVVVTSHQTPQFASGAIRLWWIKVGGRVYPGQKPSVDRSGLRRGEMAIAAGCEIRAPAVGGRVRLLTINCHALADERVQMESD